MKVEVYDADDRSDLNNLKKQDYIGCAEFMMHELIRSKNQKLTLDLKNNSQHGGKVIMQVEELKDKFSSNLALLNIECYSAKNSSELFYRLSRQTATGFVPVYQSEAIKKIDGNILWHKLKIQTAALFRDNESSPLKIDIYQFSSSGNHKLLDFQ